MMPAQMRIERLTRIMSQVFQVRRADCVMFSQFMWIHMEQGSMRASMEEKIAPMRPTRLWVKRKVSPRKAWDEGRTGVPREDGDRLSDDVREQDAAECAAEPNEPVRRGRLVEVARVAERADEQPP